MDPIPPPSTTQVRGWLQQALDRQRQGDGAGALALYRRILTAQPHHFEALQGAAIVHAQQGRLGEALSLFTTACKVQPDNAAAHFNRGKVLQGLQRYNDALAAYDQALTLKPHFAEACNNRGNTLKDLQRYDEAIASYDRALALRPAYSNALSNRGAVHTLLHRYDQALADYDRLLALHPDVPAARYNRALLLDQLKCHDQALADYDRVLALDADFPYAQGDRLHAQLRLGLWDEFEPRVTRIAEALRHGRPAGRPFALLGLPVSPASLRQGAARYTADKFPPSPQPLWQGQRRHHERLRIGYCSADFHSHATAYLAAGLFEHHDRARFEVLGFSFGPSQQDAMRARLEQGFDRFFDVAGLSDRDIAALVHRHEIDIAVDLKGYTLDCRPGIFAQRPAPLQVNYLGYPGTLAAPYMDYILADPVVIPEDHFPYYSEKVAQLLHSYQVNDDRREIAATTPARSALGLPDSGLVLCCFNNTFKITPDVFALWMRLLAEVEDAVLWLFEDHSAVPVNLARAAQRHGIDPARLVFAARLPLAEHLARLRRADLFLDTFYYNAHTTASDALWAGVPVITCLGDAFAGRVAASLLQAVGLHELIARSHDDYYALARRLAIHRDELSAVRQRLAAQRRTAPLFDTARFARNIEAIYTAMWQRHQLGLPPDHLRALLP